MDKYKFGEFIYNQRKLIGMTQDELGRKLNVTNKAVSKWETGETLPDIQLLEKLASTLNVTIDELLTQRKEEKVVEKEVIKPRIYLHVIQAVISFVLLLIVVFLLVKPNDSNSNVYINKENVTSYFEISPCEQSHVDGTTLTVMGSIKPVKNIELIDPSLTLSFSIQYYYINNSDELSEVLYVKRYISYNSEQNGFSITVEPKDPIENFKSFYGFNIVYEVVEAKGSARTLL